MPRRLYSLVWPWIVAFLVVCELVLAGAFLVYRPHVARHYYPEDTSPHVSALKESLAAKVVALREAELLIRSQSSSSATPPSPEEWRTFLATVDQARLFLVFQQRSSPDLTPPAAAAPKPATPAAQNRGRKGEGLSSTNPALKNAEALRKAADQERYALIADLQIAREIALNELHSESPHLASLMPPDRLLVAQRRQELSASRPQPIITEGEFNILWIAVGFGAIGAIVQGLWSLVIFAGNRAFRGSWTLFYLVRPIVGGGLALTFSFIIKGGFMSLGDDSAKAVPVFAFGAMSLLTGFFTGEAMEKLRDLAAIILKKNEHRDTLGDNAPAVETYVVEQLPGPPPVWKLTLTGIGLAEVGAVFVDRDSYPFVVAADGGLTVTIPDAAYTTGQKASLVVVRITPPVAISAAKTIRFKV